MNKQDMAKVIDRYAVANADKKSVTAEVAELGSAIKTYFAERDISTFATADNVASVNYRTTRAVDLQKVAAKFGGTIPEDCYTETQTPYLTVKAIKKAKAVADAIHAA